MNLGICPVCKSEVDPSRTMESIVICQSCGHVISSPSNDNPVKDINILSISIMLIVSTLVCGSFLHSTRWGNHALKIIPLKAKVLVGMADERTHTEIQEICFDRKMVECVKTSLYQQLEMDPKNPEILQQTAKLNYRMKNWEEATDLYGQYFENGGNALEPAYHYGKLLGMAGHIDRSTEYFEFVLKAKPDVLQVTVTEAYMDMLISSDRMKEAKDLAKSVERRTEKIPGSLLARFEKVDEILNPTKEATKN